MMKVSIWGLVSTLVSIISLFYILIDHRQRRKETKPVRDSLISLFNDVKAKSLLCFTKQNILFNPNNPHKDVETLRWDFGDFLYTLIQSLQGFQEHIVGALKALEVDEKEVFKAADFGLTAEEKEMKSLWWKKQKLEQGLLMEPQKKDKDVVPVQTQK